MSAGNSSQVAALAKRAAQGDENAFNELYRLTRDHAWFVAHAIARDEQDALDILQESYMKAWKKLREMESPEVCAAWVYQIVGNTAKDFMKKRRPQLFVPRDDEDDALDWQPEQDSGYIPDAAMDTAETRRLIMEIVEGLSEDQRLCVLMYYYDDLDLPEIAAALEVPVGTVKSRLHRARGKISDGVEVLARNGTQLYGAAPIPLLVWLLRGVAAESSHALPYAVLGSGGAIAGGAAAAATFAVARGRALVDELPAH